MGRNRIYLLLAITLFCTACSLHDGQLKGIQVVSEGYSGRRGFKHTVHYQIVIYEENDTCRVFAVDGVPVGTKTIFSGVVPRTEVRDLLRLIDAIGDKQYYEPNIDGSSCSLITVRDSGSATKVISMLAGAHLDTTTVKLNEVYRSIASVVDYFPPTDSAKRPIELVLKRIYELAFKYGTQRSTSMRLTCFVGHIELVHAISLASPRWPKYEVNEIEKYWRADGDSFSKGYYAYALGGDSMLVVDNTQLTLRTAGKSSVIAEFVVDLSVSNNRRFAAFAKRIARRQYEMYVLRLSDMRLLGISDTIANCNWFSVTSDGMLYFEFNGEIYKWWMDEAGFR